MKKVFVACLMVCLALTTAKLALAEVHGYFWLGGMERFLDYTEKENGATLDRDHGWLPGVDYGMFFTERNWVLRGMGKWAKTSSATYNGQTQDGVPLNFGHEPETIWTIEADIGYTFHPTAFDVIPYAGLGYRRWKRGKAQIVAYVQGKPVWDYKEVYRWGYIPVGLILEKTIPNRFTIDIDGAILFPFAQHMTAYDSEIDPSYSNVDFDLGWRPGFRVEIPMQIYFTKTTAFYIKPVYTYWNIGKSNTVVANGALNWEPHSITHYYGVSCGLVFHF